MELLLLTYVGLPTLLDLGKVSELLVESLLFLFFSNAADVYHLRVEGLHDGAVAVGRDA